MSIKCQSSLACYNFPESTYPWSWWLICAPGPTLCHHLCLRASPDADTVGSLYWSISFSSSWIFDSQPSHVYFFISQELKEKQRAFESKAKLLSQLAGEKSSTSQEPNFKNNMAPLQRKQSTATKPNKQKAVVQPLQGQFEITQITFNSTNLAYRQKWVHGWNLNWHQCKNHHIKTKSSRYYSHYLTCC